MKNLIYIIFFYYFIFRTIMIYIISLYGPEINNSIDIASRINSILIDDLPKAGYGGGVQEALLFYLSRGSLLLECSHPILNHASIPLRTPIQVGAQEILPFPTIGGEGEEGWFPIEPYSQYLIISDELNGIHGECRWSKL